MRRAFVALQFNRIEGDYAEFGCCGATTFRLSYAASQLAGVSPHMWAFDSFAGLPAPVDPRDDHPVWQQGHLAMSKRDFIEACDRAGVPPDAYTIVSGFYSESLTQRGSQGLPKKVALAYVDCDMYSSTCEVLKYLVPRLGHGSILAFDDYFCWAPDAAGGERLAALETFRDHPSLRLVPYIQFGWHGLSFMVEDRTFAA